MIRKKLTFITMVLVLGVPLWCHSAAPPVGFVPEKEALTPPFDLSDPARIEAGKKRFAANCAAYCHGHEGSGGKVPAFKGRGHYPPGDIFTVITNGRRTSDIMPSWRGYSDEERWELVAYIVWLTEQEPDQK